jgi:hypothetical protein
MAILSQLPSENPNAFKNKTVNISSGSTTNGSYEQAEIKYKCVLFVLTLKKFVKTMISKCLDEFKIVHRIPIKFLSDEGDDGYVQVTTLLGEVDEPFKALNKSGEIISSGEYGYLEYRKTPTNGWISMRNGKAKPKGGNNNNNSDSNVTKCFTLIAESEWSTLVSNGNVDENMIYVFLDDDEEMY